VLEITVFSTNSLIIIITPSIIMKQIGLQFFIRHTAEQGLLMLFSAFLTC